MTGRACPECGRRTTAGEPGAEHRVPPCRCGTETDADATRLLGDELRAARSAEMAAAEDFDPLRIRPYVTLGHASAGDGPQTTGDGPVKGDGPETTGDGPAVGGAVRGPAAGGSGGAGGADAATTMRLNLDDVRGPVGATGPGSDPRTVMGPRTGMAAGPGHGPGAPPAADESRRRTAAMGVGPGFGAEPPFGAPPGAPDPVQPRRRRPLAALAVGAAVAAVVGTAAFAGGLFDRDGSQDEALPEATTSAPAPADEPAAASVAPSPSPSAVPSRTASASPSPSASASPSVSASPSASAEPSPSASATPTPGTSSAPASESPAPPSAAPPAEAAPPSLRRGDQGPQVGELQNRLKEVWLYHGPSDGDFTERVENAVRVYQSYQAIQGDPPGVYGPNTRRVLEAETTGRGRG